jgi:integrase
MVETELDRGLWLDPEAGDIRLDVYAPRWMHERPVELQPRTVEIYETLLRKHLYPAFGATPINKITSAAVRTWHADLRAQGLGQVTVAKAYRLLKAILNTALEDDLIARSPCRLKAAGVERSPERRPPSLAEVDLIADAIEPRYRLLVLLGAWSGLRWGELGRSPGSAWTSCTACCTSSRRWCRPATRSGTSDRPRLQPDAARWRSRRTCGRRSMHTWPRSSGRSRARWCSARRAARRWTARTSTPTGTARSMRRTCRATTSTTCGLAATMAAVSGATTRELMRRMGHSSQRAALIYQHAACCGGRRGEPRVAP